MNTRKKGKVLLSPFFRTASFFISVILSGIFCGVFIIEISTSNGLNWINFYKTWSFYAILVLLIIIYIYNKFKYNNDKEISNFMDQEFCKAYLRSECLPELADKFNSIVRNGMNQSELKDINEVINGLLK